jgi:aminopeptidase N
MKPASMILALLYCAPLAVADNYPRQPAIDIQHYIFRVTLSDEKDEIAGETTVSVRFLKDGVASFWLDLASAANGKGMTVSEVTSAGAAAQFAHQNGRLTISTGAAPKAGELREYP